MRRPCIFALVSFLAILTIQASEPVVRLVDFETTVNPVTAKRITRAIDEAEAASEELVLIKLDTPGGLVTSMEAIVKEMLAAEVPVVVWVGPSGAKAASAGFFILIAADVAAMAPGTRTGAASTVFGTGGESTEDNIHLKKANEDLAALIRSIADQRGRNAEACEKAVFSAKAYEETVALEEGLIDLISKDTTELLEALHSREITRFDGTVVTLNTKNARFVTTEFSFKQDAMEILGNPTVAYLLLMLGLLGIYVEFTHPGVVFPGVVGALCLLLFAFAAQVLPLSSIGILLIILAIVMFILEIKVVSYGMLTFGGVLSLVIGSAMLFEGPIPELRVPYSLVIPTSIVIAAVCVFVVWLAVRAQRERVGTGREGLKGKTAVVTEELDPHGKIFVHGEIWNAASSGGAIPQGAKVRIVKVDEMLLTVQSTHSEPS
jgi:membrane-bound serine protease (ClpP class)